MYVHKVQKYVNYAHTPESNSISSIAQTVSLSMAFVAAAQRGLDYTGYAVARVLPPLKPSRVKLLAGLQLHILQLMLCHLQWVEMLKWMLKCAAARRKGGSGSVTVT